MTGQGGGLRVNNREAELPALRREMQGRCQVESYEGVRHTPTERKAVCVRKENALRAENIARGHKGSQNFLFPNHRRVLGKKRLRWDLTEVNSASAENS